MRFSNLGTMKQVSKIGFGFSGFSRDSSQNPLTDLEKISNLRFGIESGINLIDTAEAYLSGHSESLIGIATKPIRSDVYIATKFSPENSGYREVMLSADNSLRRLMSDYIDLYQIHWPNISVPFEETLKGIQELVQSGKVLNLGVCNFNKHQLQKAIEIIGAEKIVCNQLEYNLFDRSIENSILPFCKANGIRIVAYSPLDRGRLVASKNCLRILGDISQNYSKTIAQVILNWLTHSDDVLAITESTKKNHILENCSSQDFLLTVKEIDSINKYCKNDIVEVDPSAINVIGNGMKNAKVYRTLEDAIKNEYDLSPSPCELAEEIRNDEQIKPVRLVQAHSDSTDGYDLVEGPIRYWAWVIAFSGQRKIPALIRDDI